MRRKEWEDGVYDPSPDSRGLVLYVLRRFMMDEGVWFDNNAYIDSRDAVGKAKFRAALKEHIWQLIGTEPRLARESGKDGKQQWIIYLE